MEQDKIAEAPLEALLSRHWDVAVFGAGYAGYAAATAAEAAGKNVLLLDARCDLLWESARARQPLPGKITPEFAPFARSLACATGIAEDWIDPGSAEWVANELLMERKNLTRLYYAVPVAVETSGKLLAKVTFALRDRLVSISAAQWVDASENAALARLCAPRLTLPQPIRRELRLFLQRTRWTVKTPMQIPAPIFGIHATLENSGWSSERILKIEIGCGYKGELHAVAAPCLAALRTRLGEKCDNPLLSHWSYDPYPFYPKAASSTASPAENLALAVPALSAALVETLTDRFMLGLSAFGKLARAKKAPAPKNKGKAPAHPIATRVLEADVFIAGLGTGGVFAAIAAARSGAKVLAAESQTLPGGVPTHGGIPNYYWGCPGGLQVEVDEAVKKMMALCVTDAQLPSGYHAFARRIVTDDLLSKSGVTALYGAEVISSCVKLDGGKIISSLVATPDGIAEVRAREWIDCTGEGFLAASAGVKFDCGRDGDGSLNAFTQSWGAFGYFRDGLQMFNPNIDCGYVDPDDSLDMTTARISGMHLLVDTSTVRSSNSFNRTTGVMPSVGLRQGKLAETRYRMTIDDMVGRRTFDDAIGYTGGHIDNHSEDFFAESKDLAFYNWCALAWGFPTACEIPYRALLPVGVSNLWMACRAAGCTAETANAFRMQRDFQRTGEAAGLAAALAAKLGVESDQIPLAKLRAALILSGALTPLNDKHLMFGRGTTTFEGDPLLTGPATPGNIRKWVAALGGDKAGLSMWRLYRLGPAKVSALVKPLLGASGAKGRNAALLLGAFGDKDALPALRKVVDGRETIPSGWRAVQPYTAAAWAMAFCCDRPALKSLAALAADKAIAPIPRLAALWSMADALRRLGAKPADAKLAQAAIDGARDIAVPLRPWERAFVAERLRKTAGLPADDADRDALVSSPWKLVRKSVSKI